MPKIKTKKKGNIFSQIKWGESYTSLFLGVVVVIVLAVLIFSFIKNQNEMAIDSSKTSASSEDQKTKATEYVVKEGDDLWKISEKLYGTGYNWTDIVVANELENPEVLFVGTKLTIPSINPIKAEDVAANMATDQNTGLEAIKGTSYKVVVGDNLWDIALRAYGDGYKWTEIAKVNNLTNPDLIHADNVLKLPR